MSTRDWIFVLVLVWSPCIAFWLGAELASRHDRRLRRALARDAMRRRFTVRPELAAGEPPAAERP